jgi:hypothetical protein
MPRFKDVLQQTGPDDFRTFFQALGDRTLHEISNHRSCPIDTYFQTEKGIRTGTGFATIIPYGRKRDYQLPPWMVQFKQFVDGNELGPNGFRKQWSELTGQDLITLLDQALAEEVPV